MKILDNIYFNPSGCLTSEGLRTYVFKQVDSQMRTQVENHLKSCALCQDAIEGIGILSNEHVYGKNLKILTNSQGKYLRSRTQVSSKWIVTVSSIAASFLIMMVLFNTLHRAKTPPSGIPFSEAITDLYPIIERPAPPSIEGSGTDLHIDQDLMVDFMPDNLTDESKDENITLYPKRPIGKTQVNSGTYPTLSMVRNTPKKMENKQVQELQLIFPEEKPRYGYAYNQQDVVVARFLSDERKDAYVLPSFQSAGVEGFLKYIQKNIRYPQEAIEKDISGVVMVDFTVNEQGLVTDIQITRGVHSLLNNEAYRVIKSSPRWRPGRLGRKSTSVNFTCPVVFQLAKR